MSTEIKLHILEALNKEWASSLRISKSHPDLADRHATSLMLNSMKDGGLIKKEGNGYYRITDDGKSYLMEHSGGSREDAITLTEPEKPCSDHSMIDVPQAGNTAAVNTAPARQPEPEPEPQSMATHWASLSALMSIVPDNTSVVIENDAVFVVFADATFNVGQDGDIEAILRAVKLYKGPAV